jgi:transposase
LYNECMDKDMRIADLQAEIARLYIIVNELSGENAKLSGENAKLNGENAKLNGENAKLNGEIVKLQALNDWYLGQFRLAQQRRFGASSERTEVPEQLGLFDEAEVLADEPESTQVAAHTRKKRKGKREELYENLQTEQVVHELPEDQRICSICGGPLHVCGHEVIQREVKVIPAQVMAVEHVQTVYGCRKCEQDPDLDAAPIVKADVPAPVIPGSGIASPSLLAFILCNKYVLGLPLYRQEQELARLGLHISRQTMANWAVFAAVHWLMAIYALLHIELVLGDILHGDETTLQVVKEDGRRASQKSYMWVYSTGKDAGRQVVLFEYQQTREGKHPLMFLEGFQGYLHVDAYAGYSALEQYGVTLVKCWSHVRRKFDEALKALKKDERRHFPANTGLEYCNKLFALERKFDELNLTNEERIKHRDAESKPIAEEFFAWVDSMLPKSRPRSKLGVALQYAANQKPWLMNFLLDGRLELSNNRAERSIRPFAVGRNNWLFSYSAKGANASAVIYSIVETAMANGLVPILYLQFLFEKLPNILPEQYHTCLPWSSAVQDACRIPPPKDN